MNITLLVHWTVLTLLSIPLLIGPWIFGSWEVWHFWPMVTLIFSAVLAWGFALWLEGISPSTPAPATSPSRMTRFILVSYIVFLAYAFMRFLQSPVFMDAERNFLLLLSPFLLALLTLYASTPRMRHALYMAIWINLILLGLYGILNHFFFNNAYVMWLPGEPQYQLGSLRATGSYVCPDHFAGIMEIALALGLGYLLARQPSRPLQFLAIITVGIGFMGAILSKSRGAGLTIMVMLVAVTFWCLSAWPARVRNYLRLSMCAGLIVLAASLFLLNHSYAQRFRSYISLPASDTPASFSETAQEITRQLRQTCRGQMFAGAWRAWTSSRRHLWFGIGPGMHQHLWFHFCASNDGDRERHIRPSLWYGHLHSYEVHNDWLQLLEEHGLIGLTLFLVPALGLFWAYLSRLRPRPGHARGQPSPRLIGGFLVLVAMAFHSLGDFNLQMPATTWMFAFLITLPFTDDQDEPVENAGVPS